jgi:hypothetical protein
VSILAPNCVVTTNIRSTIAAMPEQKTVVPDAKKWPDTTEHADLQTAFVLAGLDGAAQAPAPAQQQSRPKLQENLWNPAVNPLATSNHMQQLASLAMRPQNQNALFSNANALSASSLDAVRASIRASQAQQQQQQKDVSARSAQETAAAASALLSSASGGRTPAVPEHLAAAMHWLKHGGTGGETRAMQASTSATSGGGGSKASAGAGGGKSSTHRRRKSGAKGAAKGAAKAPMLSRKRNSMSMSIDACESDVGAGGGTSSNSSNNGAGKNKQFKKTKSAALGHLQV